MIGCRSSEWEPESEHMYLYWFAIKTEKYILYVQIWNTVKLTFNMHSKTDGEFGKVPSTKCFHKCTIS